MLRLLFFTLFRKEVLDMAVVYATLIIKGKKTFAQVPEKLKAEVRDVLISLDCEYMAK